MKSFIKKFSLVSLAFGGFFMMSCGDDSSSSSSLSLEDSFDIVLAKAHYDYNSKDSSLTITYPLCKESDLGSNKAWWKKENPDSVFKYTSYLDKTKALLFEKGITEPRRFEFDGGKFPVGFWSTSSAQKEEKFQTGMKFGKNHDLATVVHYSGECYAENFKTSLFEENPAMEQTEKALIDFYLKFQPLDKQVIEDEEDEKIASRNIFVAECNRITLYNDLVSIKVDELKESSGKLTVSYKGDKYNDKCPVEFSIRYAINESDCYDAYEEFSDEKKNKDVGEFNFADYSMKVDFNRFCIEHLVLHMQEEQGVSFKKSTSSQLDGNDFAKGVVRLVLSGLK